MTEGATADHGDADAGGAGGCGRGEAGGGEDGGDEEGGLVAYAAGGVLVDSEGVEGGGVEDFAGDAHGGGEVGELLRGEAAEEDGHEERGGLGVGDGAVDYAADEVADLIGGEGECVALVADDVGDVEGSLDGHGATLSLDAGQGVSEEGVGEEVGDGGFDGGAVGAGEVDAGGGVANSRMVWRQAPQGAQGALLRLTMTTARMRMVGPWRATAAAIADCSAQVVRR